MLSAGIDILEWFRLNLKLSCIRKKPDNSDFEPIQRIDSHNFREYNKMTSSSRSCPQSLCVNHLAREFTQLSHFVSMEAPGYVQTVCGKISPSEVGVTLCHEHLFVDYASNFARPTEGSSRCGVGGLSMEELDELWEKPMTHEIAGKY
jgi:hypothetical protein